MVRTLSTAEERREAVLSAAVEVFAARGLHGTPTTGIARAAGISQAYLFRLFPTKTELFVAAVERCHELLVEAFRDAARGSAGEDALTAMGAAYVELLDERRELLRLQLHAHAAAEEPAVRAAVRTGFAHIYDTVRELSGAGPEEIADFIRHGMLLNVMAAMDAAAVDEPWAHALVEKDSDGCA